MEGERLQPRRDDCFVCVKVFLAGVVARLGLLEITGGNASFAKKQFSSNMGERPLSCMRPRLAETHCGL